jgi:hypothetical protein
VAPVQGLIRIGSSDLGLFGCSCLLSQGLLPGRLVGDLALLGQFRG